MKWKFLWCNKWIPCVPLIKKNQKILKFRKSGYLWISNSWNGGTWFFKLKDCKEVKRKWKQKK